MISGKGGGDNVDEEGELTGVVSIEVIVVVDCDMAVQVCSSRSATWDSTWKKRSIEYQRTVRGVSLQTTDPVVTVQCNTVNNPATQPYRDDTSLE
jgi:hypothetical protein